MNLSALWPANREVDPIFPEGVEIPVVRVDCDYETGVERLARVPNRRLSHSELEMPFGRGRVGLVL
jgi:hypothetical protein